MRRQKRENKSLKPGAIFSHARETKSFISSFLIAAVLLSASFCFVSPVSPQAAPASSPEKTLEVFDEVWETIEENYYDRNLRGLDWKAERVKFRTLAARVKTQEELYRLLREMISDLRDSHTRIYAPEEKFDWRKPRAVTVGLSIREVENELIVAKIAEDSAAAKAGLKVGDVVTSVDDQAAKILFARKIEEKRGASTPAAARYRAAASLFEGAAGTTARVCWRREDLIPERCAGLPREWREFGANLRANREKDVLIIGFDSFTADAVRDFFEVLRQHSRSNLKGIVLDFRSNRGGDIQALTDAVSAFLPAKTKIGKFIDRKGRVAIETDARQSSIYAPNLPRFQNKPVVVLTGTSTASAAEIFAAGLKNARRARVIGTTTCGCVLGVKTRYSLPDGGALEISELDFQLANGERLEGTGVTPDDFIELKRDDLKQNRDRALEKAIEHLQKS
jgi:carboxyl-terminal processing protease